MDMGTKLLQTQNFSLQLRTNLALDQGLVELHEIVDYHKEDISSKNFLKDVTNFLLSSNKKQYFSRYVLQSNFLRENKPLLEGIINYAINNHKNQFRDSGHPYIVHVLGVGFVLARLGFPKEVIYAGFLHDSVENIKGAVNKAEALNKIYRDFDKNTAFYVYSVSAPEINDAVKKDEMLYNKLLECSRMANNLFPMAIKCVDSVPVNVFDVEHMKEKDGRSARARQLRFLATARSKALPFAKAIDSAGYIPIRGRGEKFSLEEYVRETINDKLYTLKNK